MRRRWATGSATGTRTTSPNGVLAQQYLPDEAGDTIVFRPGAHGDEVSLAERLAEVDRILGKRR